jgi:hypothetical protein
MINGIGDRGKKKTTEEWACIVNEAKALREPQSNGVSNFSPSGISGGLDFAH